MSLDITRKAQRAFVLQLKAASLADLNEGHIEEGYGTGPTGFLGFLGTKLPRIGIACEEADPPDDDPESGEVQATISVEIRSQTHDTGPDKHGERVRAVELELYQDPLTLASSLTSLVSDFTATHIQRGPESQEVDGDVLVTTLTLTMICIGSDLEEPLYALTDESGAPILTENSELILYR